jgi:hypothetical protein
MGRILLESERVGHSQMGKEETKGSSAGAVGGSVMMRSN